MKYCKLCRVSIVCDTLHISDDDDDDMRCVVLCCVVLFYVIYLISSCVFEYVCVCAVTALYLFEYDDRKYRTSLVFDTLSSLSHDNE